MSSILKVDTIQDQSGNNIINENADTITIGASGDTITIPSGATLSNLGTAVVLYGNQFKQQDSQQLKVMLILAILHQLHLQLLYLQHLVQEIKFN
jgi:hypothetical protein